MLRSLRVFQSVRFADIYKDASRLDQPPRRFAPPRLGKAGNQRLILGRFFHAVDDDDFDWSLCRFELQSEWLQHSEHGWERLDFDDLLAYRFATRDRVPLDGLHRLSRSEPGHLDIKETWNAGLIQDNAPSPYREHFREVTHIHTLAQQHEFPASRHKGVTMAGQTRSPQLIAMIAPNLLTAISIFRRGLELHCVLRRDERIHRHFPGLPMHFQFESLGEQ